jgi:hypothetical protein
VQGRQLLAGSGDVTLRGQHLPGPAADVRLGWRGRDAVRHGHDKNHSNQDPQMSRIRQVNDRGQHGGAAN